MVRLMPIKAIPAGKQAIIIFDGPLNIESIEGKVKPAVEQGIPCLLVGDNIAIPVAMINTKAGQSTLSLAGGVPGGMIANEFHQLELDQYLLMKIEVFLEMLH